MSGRIMIYGHDVTPEDSDFPGNISIADPNGGNVTIVYSKDYKADAHGVPSSFQGSSDETSPSDPSKYRTIIILPNGSTAVVGRGGTHVQGGTLNVKGDVTF
jgi:hypothetical protein